jgi:hypothetical protein
MSAYVGVKLIKINLPEGSPLIVHYGVAAIFFLLISTDYRNRFPFKDAILLDVLCPDCLKLNLTTVADLM